MSAVRRTWRGVSNETAAMSPAAGSRYSSCRLTKWKVGQAEPLRDRRAAGHREHDAKHHQRAQAGEQPAVDRPPPVGEEGSFGA